MNIEYLNSFLVAADLNSFSKASKKLNITHTALSKQIRQVEDYFEIEVFKRSTSGVELTEAGKLIYKRIKLIQEDLLSLKNEISIIKEEKIFTIGMLPSLAKNMPSKLLKLRDGKINFEIKINYTSAELRELLEKGEVDVIIAENETVHHSFWHKKLFEETLYLVMPKTHKLAIKESISLQEINNESLVLYPPNCSIRKKITEVLSFEGTELKVITEVDFSDFLLGYVAAGAGITVLPEVEVKYLGQPTLKAIPITNSTAKRNISLITRSERTGKMLFKYFK